MTADSELQRYEEDWRGFTRLLTIVAFTIVGVLTLMAVFLT